MSGCDRLRLATRVAWALALAPLLAGCKDRTREFPEPETESPEGIPYRTDCAALSDLPKPELGGGAYVADYLAVWETVLDKHYDPTLGCLDWSVVGERYGKRVVEAGDDAARAYEVINEMLGLLGQSHMRANPPAQANGPQRKLPAGPARVPIELRLIEKQVVVTRQLPSATPAARGDDPEAEPQEAEQVEVPPEDPPVPTGAVVRAIGGVDLGSLLAEEGPVEGRPREQSRSQATSINRLLSCPEATSRAITYEDVSGQAQTSEVPCRLPAGKRVTLGNLKNLSSYVEFEMMDSDAGVGWLRFNVWMMPLMPQIRSAMAELRAAGMKALVLDLRQNPGGVGQMSSPVARLLLDEPAELGSMQMRDFRTELKVLSGSEDPFLGHVQILVDEGTASTSEIFAIAMRDLKRATIVGAGPSAGMALPSIIETLPSGGTLQFVVGDYRSPDGNVPEGTGVEPDIRVEEDRKGFANGGDPVLDRAVAEAKKALEASQ